MVFDWLEYLGHDVRFAKVIGSWYPIG